MKLAATHTVEQSPVLLLSLEGVRRWLSSEWSRRVDDPKLVTLFTVNQTDRQEANLITGRRRDQSVALPYALLVVTNVAVRTEGFNRHALQMIGIRTGRPSAPRERREKFTPVDVGVGVKVVCRDPEEALMVARIWAENYPAARVRVVQNSTGFSFDLSVMPDQSVEVPTDDASADQSRTLELTTTLILKTFVGTTETNKLITRLRRSVRSVEDMAGNDRDDWDRGQSISPDQDVDFYTMHPDRRDVVLERLEGSR